MISYLFCRMHERQEETTEPDVQSDTGSEENTSNHYNAIRDLLAQVCKCVRVWVKFVWINLRMKVTNRSDAYANASDIDTDTLYHTSNGGNRYWYCGTCSRAS